MITFLISLLLSSAAPEPVLTHVSRVAISAAFPSRSDDGIVVVGVPEISRFFGIVIGMFFNEHAKPHFHARHGDFKITVDINSGLVRGHSRSRSGGWFLNGVDSTEQNYWRTGNVHGATSYSRLLRRWSNDVDYDVIEARHLDGFVVWLRFRDGTAGEIDLEPHLWGPVFEPLRDPAFFAQFEIHPLFHTLVWSNGADFAPEFLHDNIRVTA